MNINSAIEKILVYSEPQDGAFISGFDLVHLKDWVKNVYSELETNDDARALKVLVKFLKENCKAQLIEEHLLGGTQYDEDDDEMVDLDDFGGVETAIPISELQDSYVDLPKDKKFTHFMILPVDYNRPGYDPEICIAWLTSLGAKVLEGKLTGDY